MAGEPNTLVAPSRSRRPPGSRRSEHEAGRSGADDRDRRVRCVRRQGLASTQPSRHHVDSTRTRRSARMCRNIRTLFNFDPAATDEEVRASALQFVRKLSGFNKPSQANRAAFDTAVDEVAAAARKLLDSLVTTAPSRDRDVEATKARARSAQRFGRAASAGA
jgi:hypothetical protein